MSITQVSPILFYQYISTLNFTYHRMNIFIISRAQISEWKTTKINSDFMIPVLSFSIKIHKDCYAVFYMSMDT